MIERTLCHLPGISLADEKDLWRKGVGTWDDLLCWAAVFASDDRYDQLKKGVADSQTAVASRKPAFFLKRMPELEWYRVYHDFPDQFYLLDIETSGLQDSAEITCISILAAGTMHSFSAVADLEAAADLLASIRIAVTFKGARFDIPRLMRRFPAFLPKFHLDLAKVLAKEKIRGNLKEVALRLGWTEDEKNLAITGGEEAAQAWTSYKQSGDPSLLDMLITYNQKDVEELAYILRVLERRHIQASGS